MDDVNEIASKKNCIIWWLTLAPTFRFRNILINSTAPDVLLSLLK